MLKKILGAAGDPRNVGYTLNLANSGQGINFHKKRLGSDGEMEYQKVYVVKNIPPAQLKKFIGSYGRIKMLDSAVSLFYPAFSDKMIKWLYRHLPKLGATVREKDARFWGKPQIGSSCTGQAELALLKANLATESYDKLQTHLRIHSIFKMYKQLVSGFDTHYSAKISLLEMVKRLQAGELNPKMRASLIEIQKKVEPRLNRQKALKLPRALKTKIFKDYAKVDPQDLKPDSLLKRACFLMANNRYQEAHQVLAILYSLPNKSNPAEVDVAKTIMKLYEAERGVPLELINLYYGVSEILQNRGLPISNQKHYKLSLIHSYAEIKSLFPASPWNMRP